MPIWDTYKDIRDRLVREEKLIDADQPGLLRFAKDVSFESPSTAASVVYGGRVSGPKEWRVQGTPQTYKD